MPPKKTAEPFALVDALLAAYETNNRLNEYLIRAIPDAAWNAEPPGGKGRTIAAIFAHMHNVRGMWLKAAAKEAGVPDKLDRFTCTKDEVIVALAESCRAIGDVLRESFAGDGRVKGFKPDAAGFLGYQISHDAHHRGQASMLARQMGHPISQSAMFGMWEWGKR